MSAFVEAVPESAGFTDRELGSKSPLTGDWRSPRQSFDGRSRGGANRGKSSGKADRAVFEEIRTNVIENEEEAAFRRARASWNRPLTGGSSRRGSSRSYTGGEININSECSKRRGVSISPTGRKSRRNDFTSKANWGERPTSSASVGKVAGGSIDGREYLQTQDKPPLTSWRKRVCHEIEDGMGISKRELASDFGSRRNGRMAGIGAKWRKRGSLGRRPVSKEAVRQLHVSEKLHRQGGIVARKREDTRRRREALQRAAVSVCSMKQSPQVRRILLLNFYGVLYNRSYTVVYSHEK